MDIKRLFQMQRELDHTIEMKNNLQGEDLFERKVFAFLVEAAELANETRCFKFWSQKGPSHKDILLEEYVDGIHFLLSLGIEKKMDSIEIQLEKVKEEPNHLNLTSYFIKVNEEALAFFRNPSTELYLKLFYTYLQLGTLLDFTLKEVEEAYFAKNKVNYQRQESNY
ncbi:dUTP diphosphatase [Bacillus litorisediminis]|uniref:dUTP diphosphatase n=1 Tax=Bacillus litorisediminis TaxID=2922713 RepID=UPI001FABEBC7|nr:dUTP diphosphatase [Bacillus litorisediminis]